MIRLFVKTYPNDFQWLKVAMVSVQKQCQEDVEWTIVTDDGTKSSFMDVIAQVSQNTNKLLNYRIFETSEHWKDSLQIGSGYLRQQWIKMTAHRVIDKGFFWNWDSDVVAKKHFIATDFMAHDKPIHWITQFNAIIDGGDRPAHEARKQMLRDIFGVPDIAFEYMRCMPSPLMGEVLRQGESSSYWQEAFQMMIQGQSRVSEFNIIGLFSHLYFPDVYEWRNTQNYNKTFGDIVTQYWSYGGCPENVYNEVMK